MWGSGEPGDVAQRRRLMVERDIASRGVTDARVLDAMASVPREKFLPDRLAEFAYEDTPLPIDEGQTISQPLMVALMTEAAELDGGSRVLEIGAGSGYGAAVLSRIAADVWTIERHALLADQAAGRLAELGCDNTRVVHGDGTLGLPEHAPFDAIVVTAGGPSIPEALIEQLVDGGRLVIPVGADTRGQRLLRIRRTGDDIVEEDLGPVRFVPLVGRQGWRPSAVSAPAAGRRPRLVPTGAAGPAGLVREEAEAMPSIEGAELGGLLDRIGDCPVVLLGEASHGTSEFHRLRTRITRELILRRGFTAVAVEADHLDAACVDAWIRQRPPPGTPFEPFSRFPTWMWRNREVRELVDWLQLYNVDLPPERRVSFHGLDVYGLYTSLAAVIEYLEGIDPEAAALARHRYGCLTPWQHDPDTYGRAVVTGRFAGCEDEVVEVLIDRLRRRLELGAGVGRGAGDDPIDRYVDVAHRALVTANAERYYRVMYHGSRASWNLRDHHMFDTLQTIRSRRTAADGARDDRDPDGGVDDGTGDGSPAKVVVWEHNAHIGDASATEMGAGGEHNVGLLARREYGDGAYLVGFGTHDGVVAAAREWGGPMERKAIPPSHPDSYERLCHDTGLPAFLLPLRDPDHRDLHDELGRPRLERAIGVVYRPETELQSHYFQASLPQQFDEYVWFDRTSPIHPVVGAGPPLGPPR